MVQNPEPITLEIKNVKGLHARAAAKFVRCASQFRAEIKVAKDANEVDGTSIMGLLMLAASKGTVIQVSATGVEAEPALAAITNLIEGRFDEE